MKFHIAVALAVTTFFCQHAISSRAQALAPCPTQPNKEQQPIFETVSIRPSRADSTFDQQVLPNGFQVRGSSFWRLIQMAYDPDEFVSGTSITNAPDWVEHEYFDIQAKVSSDFVQEWQRRTSLTPHNSFFKCALQQMLADRLALKLHDNAVLSNGFVLVIAKSGPGKDLKTAKPAHEETTDYEPRQQPVWLPENQAAVRFTQTPLSKLATFLGSLSTVKVEDRTGLKGLYDFTVRDNMPIHPTAQESEEYRLPTTRWNLSALGLRLIPSKVHTTAMVIDHIEQPSSN